MLTLYLYQFNYYIVNYENKKQVVLNFRKYHIKKNGTEMYSNTYLSYVLCTCILKYLKFVFLIIY